MGVPKLIILTSLIVNHSNNRLRLNPLFQSNDSLNRKSLFMAIYFVKDSGDFFISKEEKYYLRHVGDDPRPKDPANFEKDFPGVEFIFKIRFILTLHFYSK
jgi:hypothetical protein